MGFNFQNFRRAVGDLSGELKKLREQIEAAKRRREDLETLPLSRADVIAKLHHLVDTTAAAYPGKLRATIDHLIRRPFYDPCARGQRLDLVGTPPRGDVIVTQPLEGLSFLLGPTLKAALAEAVMAMSWPEPVGPPPEERRAEIEGLDLKIAELEAREQALLAQAADSGVILR